MPVTDTIGLSVVYVNVGLPRRGEGDGPVTLLFCISDTLLGMCTTCGDCFLHRQTRLDEQWLLTWWECRCGFNDVMMRASVGV